MLFNFELTPLQVVQPWGEPGNLKLHWFGLTDGRYWIQAGDATLFEYSEFVLERLGGSRYCDYQVARLYEDVLEMTPHILEPLPTELVPYISGHSGRAWALTASAWREACAERADEAYWNIVDASGTWIGNRTLDSGHLSPSASIRMWSDDSFVHIEWDNREKWVGGAHAWSALCGSYKLPRSDFVHEGNRSTRDSWIKWTHASSELLQGTCQLKFKSTCQVFSVNTSNAFTSQAMCLLSPRIPPTGRPSARH